MSKSKFWKAFDNMFENMGDMFDNLGDVIEEEVKEKKVIKTIIKKVRGDDAEVHIDIDGSAKAVNEITDKIIEIVDQYNKEIKEAKK